MLYGDVQEGKITAMFYEGTRKRISLTGIVNEGDFESGGWPYHGLGWCRYSRSAIYFIQTQSGNYQLCTSESLVFGITHQTEFPAFISAKEYAKVKTYKTYLVPLYYSTHVYYIFMGLVLCIFVFTIMLMLQTIFFPGYQSFSSSGRLRFQEILEKYKT